ncbi:MAG: septum formation protein Maf [Veillonella sp.]|nr:septum formation protein Maf [Veillonella sp.]
MPFVLASTSPRRKELLTRFGVKFTVAKSSFEESHEQWPDPVAYVEAQARGKAAHVIMGENEPDEYIVLGADTIVAWNGELLGKPADEADAVRMLTELSGQAHQVITGMCLRHVNRKTGDEKSISFSVTTDVIFYDLSDEEIKAYAATGEGLDKAGAYGIQGLGGYLVKGIEGSYTNVVGLPVEVVLRKLNEL